MVEGVREMNRRTFLITGGLMLTGYALPAWAGKSGGAGLHDPVDSISRSRNFDRNYPGDVFLVEERRGLLKSSLKRIKRVQRTVGHGHFALLSFDDMLKIARNYSSVGGFTPKELDFLESIFYDKAERYGFMGEKPFGKITDRIRKSAAVKIPATGNYVYKGPSLELHEKLMKHMGDSAILTSGLRGVSKQFLLFLAKARSCSGNLSRASRSLAPPGYSYHGVGDFDIGRRGFGAANFTLRFTTTDVYKKLCDMGYVDFRYNTDNRLGVRFEPWHIKVRARI